VSAPRHFGERRHAWAIDDQDGRLVAADPSDLCDCTIKTRLWHTREEATAARRRLGMGRVVRVAVKYEVVS
jgi:hypothetical protein